MNKEIILKDIKKIPKQIIGYMIIGFSVYLLKLMNLGMHPWGTLQLGIVNITGLPFGTISQLVGFTIIVISFFLKIYPGLGTLLNMFFIGFFINIYESINLIPQPSNIWLRVFLVLVAQIIFNYGIYFYISCGIGAGPRDGLMVGLVKKTGKSVTIIKTTLEATVFIIGFLLGGTIGIGTVIVTFSGGWILNKIFELHKYNPKEEHHTKLTDYFKSTVK